MSEKNRPNILLLIADQLQHQVTMPGSPCLTPNMEKLRASGTSFTRTRTVNPICSPARASLFTGRLPHIHGMVDNTHCVEPFRAEFQSSIPTLSSHLQSHGYRTGYFGKWHVERSSTPTNFGFHEATTEYHGREFPRTLLESRTIRQPGYNDRTFFGVHSEGAEETEERFFYDQAIEFLSRGETSGPWFTVVSTNAPHDPYIAPQEFVDLYDPDQIELPQSSADTLHDKPGIYRRLRGVWSDLSKRDVQEAIACYYALCTMVDAEVGRILQVLEDRGERENTIVVLTSDHGDLLGAHGLFCKGVPAFEESYRIPLVMSWPSAIEADTWIDANTSIIDVAPTLADLAGVPPLGETEGESLTRLMRAGQDTTARSTYAEFYGQRMAYSQRIVWMEQWKYVFNAFDEDELYRLDDDPHELTNLARDPAHADQLQRMAQEMWHWAKSSDDEAFLDSEYFMFRFAPLGPERSKRDNVYNRGA